MLGLVVTGVLYSTAAPGTASAAEQASSSSTTDDVAAGEKLFLANCSTCHGINAEGRDNAPSLIGVGAAAVDFQVGTGRMPMAATGPQAPKTQTVFTQEQIDQLAAYVASLSPGPEVPSAEAVDPDLGDAANGASIFRTNCAMCHNVAGKGGALTQGKYAPDLTGVSATHVYEAMLTGPQSMPVFNEQNISAEEKRDVIAYLTTINSATTPGGFSLGSLGPVSEGLVGWVVGLGLLVGAAVWVGAKAS